MNNKIVPLTIDEIGAKGDGVALHDGAPVYVPKTAPGDVIEAVIKGERGTLRKIVTRSPHRAHPVCAYFDKCGGCSLQHVTPDFYREWKIAKVKTALARAGVEPNVERAGFPRSFNTPPHDDDNAAHQERHHPRL
jgi:23S rRNA (uracil1939-C5)-methyltransferase